MESSGLTMSYQHMVPQRFELTTFSTPSSRSSQSMWSSTATTVSLPTHWATKVPTPYLHKPREPRLGSITSWNLSIEFGYTNTKENPLMGFIFLHRNLIEWTIPYQNKIELFHGDSVSKWPRLGSTTLKSGETIPWYSTLKTTKPKIVTKSQHLIIRYISCNYHF